MGVLRWVAALVASVVVVVGLWAFEPWRLFTSSEVDEPEPTSAAASDPATDETSQTPAPSPPPDETLARGKFEDGEHGTSGSATVLELGDGRRFVRFEDLATSDGPDLHVWVTDQPSGGGGGRTTTAGTSGSGS